MGNLVIVFGEVSPTKLEEIKESLKRQGKKPVVVECGLQQVKEFYADFMKPVVDRRELVYNHFGINPNAACRFVVSLNALTREQQVAVLIGVARALGAGGVRKVKEMTERVAA